MPNLHIHHKLSLIVATLTIPIVIFGALLVRDGVADLGQLKRAQSGVAAAQAAWAEAEAIAFGRPRPETSTSWAGIADLFTPEAAESVSKHWTTLSDGEASAPKKRRAANALVAAASRETGIRSAAPSDVYALPGLISYQLPTVLVRTQTLAGVTARIARKDQLGPGDRMSFLVNAGQYKGIADVISRITRTEFAGLSGREQERLAPLADAFRKANVAFQKIMAANARTVNANSRGSDLQGAELEAAAAVMLTATVELWRGSAAALDERLADERQSAFWRALGVAIAVGVALVGAISAAVLARRSILTGIANLHDAICDLADKAINAQLAAANRSDELGKIATAVGYFRDRTVERISAAELEQKEREDAQRAEILAELERGFGDVVGAAIDGDFSRRAPETFEDAALNSLARRLNELVAAFELGMLETSQVMGKLARADLSAMMTRQSRGAFLRLQDDVNDVVRSFRDIVGQLKGASVKLRDASGDITTSSEELASRISEQRDAAARTSRSMAEMVEAVLDCAQTAQSTRASISAARSAASDGREAMSGATAGMDCVRTSADKISEFIGMIEGIAAQTNMLAINASVEASRAGDAGKGFAVVAQEVRSLAQSTSHASEEVKKLVTATLNEIKSGAASVEEAASRLEKADLSISEAETSMETIASRNIRQAEELGALNDVTKHADVVAQGCAEQVENTRRAINWTDDQTQRLDRLVAHFAMEEEEKLKLAG